ncbi:hypothetical protein M885DRAFT_147143 [Pelagophyceae sp. CCMP2097]|nr:hypothetical protein M885DRAFT_147143 [Pelagophyceae sp. CCMP2097]
MFLVLAIVLVGILLYNQTESAFLTLCGLFEIIISFPIGLFFWNVVLQQKYITYLMYNGAFIILGIGADDIFVLVDAWKQSALHPDPRVRNDILLRFAWTYDRAAFAMFATSLTTSAAFFSCAASVIWDIKCFGVVNGVMVVADFLLVITWLPAAIIVRERYFPDWLKAASFTQCAKSLVRLVLCRKPVLAEPAPLAVQAVSAPPSSGGPMSTAPDYAQSERLLERFFYTSYGGFVYKRKRSILVVWSAIFAASLAVWTTLLLPDDKATPFFADDHVFEQWLRWSDEEFLLDRADDKTPSFLVFGVKQGDPWRDDQDSHPACIGDDPDCAGKPNYSGLHFAKNQLAIAAACKAYGESLSSSGQMPQYETETNAYCFMSLFHKWALSKGLAVPYAATDEIEFASKLLEWRDSDDEPFGLRFLNAASAFYGENTGFVVSDGVVKAGWAGYNTSLNWDRATFVEMWEFHDDAQSAWGAAKRQGVDREDSYQTTENYSWMVASGVFYDAARSNLLISVCLAATVMFYVTLNWAVTLVATVSLIAVIAGVLATMAIAGWKVNIIESIDISIAGGMAVDYILHLAHAFNHQESFLTGEGRVRGALGEMGVSVLSGALTTLSATCALFCCQLLWFRNFGIFIALLVVWSIVVSMLPMMALFCYIPGGDFGRVDFSGLRPKLCNKHCASAAPDEAAVAK